MSKTKKGPAVVQATGPEMVRVLYRGRGAHVLPHGRVLAPGLQAVPLRYFESLQNAGLGWAIDRLVRAGLLVFEPESEVLVPLPTGPVPPTDAEKVRWIERETDYAFLSRLMGDTSAAVVRAAAERLALLDR